MARVLGCVEVGDRPGGAAAMPNTLPETIAPKPIGRDDTDAGDRDAGPAGSHDSYNRSLVLPLVFAWLGAAAFAGSLSYFLFTFLVTFGGPSSLDPSAGWWGPASMDVALFSAFALHHSLFARSGLKRWVRTTIPAGLERALYSWIASVLFILVCAAWRPVSGVVYSIPQPWNWIGYAAQAAGIVFTFFGARSLDVLDLAGVRQVMESQRTPSDGATHVPLQTDGVYGVVRHPLYFGWVLLVLGAPHMTADRFTFALVSTLYIAVAIPFEERALEDTFGPDYARYRKHVRWRMVPGLY